jgi:DNA-binding transcriptional LysR family regulator
MDNSERLNWDDLRYLLMLFQNGGVKNAANVLRVSHQTVSRRLNQLEQTLGIRLVNKHRHPWELTEKGVKLCEMAEKMDVIAKEILRFSDEDQLDFSGPVRINSISWGHKLLVIPALKLLKKKNSQLTFQLCSDDSTVDVQAGLADIALRFTRTPPQDLIGKRVGPLLLEVFGVRNIIERLDGDQSSTVPIIKTLSAGPHQRWPIPDKRIREVVVVNDFSTLVEAAQSGLGLAILPTIVGRQSSGLVASQTINMITSNSVWLLRNEDTRGSAKIKAVEDEILNLGRTLLSDVSTARQ